MFDSIYSSGTSLVLIILMIFVSLACGIIATFILSFKIKSRKELFVTASVLPAIVSTVFVFLNIMIKKDNTTAITAIAAVMVGMGLIRFRSVQGKADEMLLLFSSVAIGAICGLGYLAYAAIFSIVIPGVYVLLVILGFLRNRKMTVEKLLKITIPESLEYNGVFDETFKHYLKEVEMVGVKTTGMGSMFRLSYRIVMKDNNEEKELIDELRIKNGNLEIAILPYYEDTKTL